LLNNEVIQQSYENPPSFNQVKVLNTFYKDEEKSLLNILLEEILITDAVNETAVIDNKIDRVFEY